MYRIPYMDAMGMVWIGLITMSTTFYFRTFGKPEKKHGNTWGKLGMPPIGHALHLRMLRISIICHTISMRKGMTFQKMKFHIYLVVLQKWHIQRYLGLGTKRKVMGSSSLVPRPKKTCCSHMKPNPLEVLSFKPACRFPDEVPRGVVQNACVFFVAERIRPPQLLWNNQTLVGGWTNPFETYDRQSGFIFPNCRGEHSKNVWVCHHLPKNSHLPSQDLLLRSPRVFARSVMPEIVASVTMGSPGTTVGPVLGS